jgi:hypothetical protein
MDTKRKRLPARKEGVVDVKWIDFDPSFRKIPVVKADLEDHSEDNNLNTSDYFKP